MSSRALEWVLARDAAWGRAASLSDDATRALLVDPARDVLARGVPVPATSTLLAFALLSFVVLLHYLIVHVRRPSLLFPRTPLNAFLVRRLPRLHRCYFPTAWLAQGPSALRATVAAFGRIEPRIKRAKGFEREMRRMADGETMALDWLHPKANSNDDAPVILVCLGVAGQADELSAQYLALELRRMGARFVTFKQRGCVHDTPSHSQPHSPAHSCTSDLRELLVHIKSRYPTAPLLGVGYSGGATLLTAYLAESAADALIDAAFTADNAFDLQEEQFGGCNERRRKQPPRGVTGLLQKLFGRKKAPSRSHKHARIAAETQNAAEAMPSTPELVSRIAVPLLILHSQDAPLAHPSPSSRPELAAALQSNPHVVQVCTWRGGGALGFREGLLPFNRASWLEKLTAEWVEVVTSAEGWQMVLQDRQLARVEAAAIVAAAAAKAARLASAAGSDAQPPSKLSDSASPPAVASSLTSELSPEPVTVSVMAMKAQQAEQQPISHDGAAVPVAALAVKELSNGSGRNRSPSQHYVHPNAPTPLFLLQRPASGSGEAHSGSDNYPALSPGESQSLRSLSLLPDLAFPEFPLSSVVRYDPTPMGETPLAEPLALPLMQLPLPSSFASDSSSSHMEGSSAGFGLETPFSSVSGGHDGSLSIPLTPHPHPHGYAFPLAQVAAPQPVPPPALLQHSSVPHPFPAAVAAVPAASSAADAAAPMDLSFDSHGAVATTNGHGTAHGEDSHDHDDTLSELGHRTPPDSPATHAKRRRLHDDSHAHHASVAAAIFAATAAAAAAAAASVAATPADTATPLSPAKRRKLDGAPMQRSSSDAHDATDNSEVQNDSASVGSGSLPPRHEHFGALPSTPLKRKAAT